MRAGCIPLHSLEKEVSEITVEQCQTKRLADMYCYLTHTHNVSRALLMQLAELLFNHNLCDC